MPQAFELAGVIGRDTLLRLLHGRIGLVPLPAPGQQVCYWHLCHSAQQKFVGQRNQPHWLDDSVRHPSPDL